MKWVGKISEAGTFLSAAIMPNISAFMAWGLLTALFTTNGWLPNPSLAQLLSPMMLYALPLMVAYTGGRRLGGDRGGAIGAIATMGLIVGSSVPMLLGAMLMGPLGGWLLIKLDYLFKRRIPLGFEMLTSNFSAAILGAVLAIINFWIIGPMMSLLNNMVMTGVAYVIDHGFLFLSAVMIEPAKVLFLNNALNHGVLSPLGMQYALVTGKSTLFLLEANPGPGLGVLLAYMLYGARESRRSAGTASIIHALGGIHEIYFPYVLMQPLLILALVSGGMVGDLYFQVQQAGLVATPSPGSLLAILALAQKNSLIHVLFGILLSTAASFGVAALLLKRTNIKKESHYENLQRTNVLDKVYVACDAGMGSSALGAALLTRLLAEKGIEARVKNTALDQVPHDATLIVTYQSLIERARRQAPGAAFIGIDDYLNKQAYEEAIQMMVKSTAQLQEVQLEIPKHRPILEIDNIRLHQPSISKREVIIRAGEMLVASGYVTEPYIEGMLAREEKFSTYIGSNVAIPHGENIVKAHVIMSGIVVLQYPQGIDFGEGRIAHLVIGIAGKGNEHIAILSNVAEAIEDEKVLKDMITTSDPMVIYEAFSKEAL